MTAPATEIGLVVDPLGGRPWPVGYDVQSWQEGDYRLCRLVLRGGSGEDDEAPLVAAPLAVAASV